MLGGDISITRVASASFSMSGGGVASLFRLMRRHVTRVGPEALCGGTTTRRPDRRQLRMVPPRASTMKLIKNLLVVQERFDGN